MIYIIRTYVLTLLKYKEKKRVGLTVKKIERKKELKERRIVELDGFGDG